MSILIVFFLPQHQHFHSQSYLTGNLTGNLTEILVVRGRGKPRGRLEIESFGTQSPKTFEFKSASRPKKQRPEAKSKILPCTFLGGGAKKWTAPPPFGGGECCDCAGTCPPGGHKKLASITPFGGGNAAIVRVHAPGGQKKLLASPLLDGGMLAASSTNVAL